MSLSTHQTQSKWSKTIYWSGYFLRYDQWRPTRLSSSCWRGGEEGSFFSSVYFQVFSFFLFHWCWLVCLVFVRHVFVCVRVCVCAVAKKCSDFCNLCVVFLIKRFVFRVGISGVWIPVVIWFIITHIRSDRSWSACFWVWGFLHCLGKVQLHLRERERERQKTGYNK